MDGHRNLSRTRFDDSYLRARSKATRVTQSMVSSTISRLVFFGGRYLSLLLVARMLGVDAAGFLLAVAVVEFFRIVFDYGLENSVLSRAHQKGNDEFARGKGTVRLVATLVGQGVTTGVIAILCLRNDVPFVVPLVASLQFSCLMGFGYLQAHLQTGKAGGMAALVRPLALATVSQGALLMLAQRGIVPVWLCAIFFEIVALIACAVVARRFKSETVYQAPASNAYFAGFDSSVFRKVLSRIAPLGNVALIGVAYTRVDVLAVSWVASGALLTQYLIYQRLASAPLMFFSTIASVSIARLSAGHSWSENLAKRINQFRKQAYIAAAASGVALAVSSPLVASFFSLQSVDLKLLGLQCLVLGLQISNGFHAAFLIALQKSSRLWLVARNNTVLAALLLPLGAWKLEAVGIALALCAVEIFGAAQYVLLFHGGKHFGERAHAE